MILWRGILPCYKSVVIPVKRALERVFISEDHLLNIVLKLDGLCSLVTLDA